ncbi:MAG TPA: baseplate J/gp47 family protein [Polyangiaceae bacterium]|nr:baseplate J/gp47 family protein [Polyangiaceae bacterium]
MPIPLPDLDDKTFDELVEEARASIPQLYPGWTDHNPSDPGITLVELFAWLTEIVIYRVGRIPDSSHAAFLQLLAGKSVTPGPGRSMEDVTRATLAGVRERFRAVTADDYEHLVVNEWPKTMAAASLATIERVKCIPEQNLAGTNKLAAAPGYVSLLVVAESDDTEVPWVQPSAGLKTELAAFFEARRLITTRLSIAGPDYIPLAINATIYMKDSGVAAIVSQKVAAALTGYYHPVTGGDDGEGWPFGGDVILAKIYAILDEVPGVDYTEDVKVTPEDATRKIKDGDELLSIRLQGHELPRVEASSITLTIMARRGDEWQPV